MQALAIVPETGGGLSAIEGREWPHSRQLLAAGFAAAWSLRLGWHILLLRTRISDIPPLEAHLLRMRTAPFASYRRRTSAYFPWPPRR